MQDLPLSCESRQAVTGVVCVGAVPSIKAAVIPPGTNAGRRRQPRKSLQINKQCQSQLVVHWYNETIEI